MLHMVFYSKIGEEEQAFDVADVLHAVCDKLIRRHPHIYGDVTVDGEEDVKANWEEIKRKEKLVKGNGADNKVKSVLAESPDAMPSLIKAYRLQEKTAQFGFEWDDIADVKAKVDEELSELDEAIRIGVKEDIEAEYGDVLFALVNYSRYLKLDPEAALEQSNRKFKHRFQYIEEQAKFQGKDLKDMTLAEMDALWNEAKKRRSTLTAPLSESGLESNYTIKDVDCTVSSTYIKTTSIKCCSTYSKCSSIESKVSTRSHSDVLTIS